MTKPQMLPTRKDAIRLAATLTVSIAFGIGLVGCSPLSSSGGSNTAASTAATGSGNVVAGGGADIPGVGASSVPTADAVVVRIQNGLEGTAMSTAGNFAKALKQLKTNLPNATDPTKATGFDQIQLLAYAACSDLTTGGNNAVMNTKYKVNPGSTITANQAALVAAGVRMMDQYTGGLASGGPTSGQVSTALTTLVTTLAGTSTNTSTIAFMSVCMAANVAGSSMLGF